MSGESIEFESRITEAGYRRVLVRVALLRLRLVLPFAAFLGFRALARGDTSMAWLWLVLTVGTALVVAAYALWASGSPSANKSVYQPVDYAVDAEGLTYTTEAGTGRVEWSQVHRTQHVADHYLLYVGSASYMLVAGDSLDEAGVRSEFEALLREHVPRRWWQRGP